MGWRGGDLELFFDFGIGFVFGGCCGSGYAHGEAFPDAGGEESPCVDKEIPAPVDHAYAFARDDGADNADYGVVKGHGHRIDAVGVEKRCAYPARTDVGEGDVELLDAGKLGERGQIGLLFLEISFFS